MFRKNITGANMERTTSCSRDLLHSPSDPFVRSPAGSVNTPSIMTIYNTSKPGSWTLRLYEVLRPAPHPFALQFSNSQSRFRHKAGEIWRHALTTSVYYDLAGENELLDKAVPRSAWRRFVRVECFGLSGLLFYEIRLPTLPGIVGAEYQRKTAFEDNGSSENTLSLATVFGDPSDADDEGMDVDDLLDVVQAKVVYFPAYACTSFIIGQAMTAFFRDQPSFRPRPSRNGFSVPLFETLCHNVNSSPVERVKGFDDTVPLGSENAEHRQTIPLSYSWQIIFDDLEVPDDVSLEIDDPHRPLCIRSSSTPPAAISYCWAFSTADDNDKDDGNTTSSTIDSFGPSTPPRTNIHQHCRSLEKTVNISEPALGAKSPNNPDLTENLEPEPLQEVSECTPTFVASGTLCLSVYDELTSFLDI